MFYSRTRKIEKRVDELMDLFIKLSSMCTSLSDKVARLEATISDVDRNIRNCRYTTSRHESFIELHENKIEELAKLIKPAKRPVGRPRKVKK